MSHDSSTPYDPRTYEPLTFHDRLAAFEDGSDTPRAFLERCLETVAEREPVVQAFAHLDADLARAAADASTGRWSRGEARSLIDGMPVGIKDLIETVDMPTQMGCEAYRGHFPKRDNAAVRALREAGAVIFGKTVTAELGNSHPGPTTNPFDPTRTPGGSSSGSAAAVAARMMPAAIGTQVGGSIIRPASYCGNVALKPSQGAINRGERQSTSMSTHGVHAGDVEDMWRVSIEIARRAGGDPGQAALAGPRRAPASRRPEALVVLQSAGWPGLDPGSRDGFGDLLSQLEARGVTLLGRETHPAVEALEQAVADAAAICAGITGWENHWALGSLIAENPEGVSERLKAIVAKAEAMDAAQYQDLLRRRAAAQQAFRSIAPLGDGVLMLSSPGPATPWPGDTPGRPLLPRPTGDAVFNCPSSMLHAPAMTVPLLAVAGLPLGVQVVGQRGMDAHVTGVARWLQEHLQPAVAC